MTESTKTVFEQIGGEETVKRLVDVFYSKVEMDAILRSIFPDDLEAGKHWQYLFLMQYFGGPQQYGQERGHPRLRMRHMPFAINAQARQLWLQYMLEAIDDVGIQEPARGVMRDYFERASEIMINRYEPESGE